MPYRLFVPNWRHFPVNLDERLFRQSKITLVSSNFGPSNSKVLECNFGPYKSMVVERNFGSSKIKVVDRNFEPAVYFYFIFCYHQNGRQISVLDQCMVVEPYFEPSKITVEDHNFGQSKITIGNPDIGPSKITIVDRNFGPSKITVQITPFGPRSLPQKCSAVDLRGLHVPPVLGAGWLGTVRQTNNSSEEEKTADCRPGRPDLSHECSFVSCGGGNRPNTCLLMVSTDYRTIGHCTLTLHNKHCTINTSH